MGVATRHSFASQAVNRGASLKLVGANMGHSGEYMTENYAHVQIEAVRTVVQDW